jgi:hypothetical protein
MKGSRSTNNSQSKQGISHKPKPEIRDDLDSRSDKQKTQVSDSRTKGKKNRKD